jgi:hypothetical protein
VTEAAKCRREVPDIDALAAAVAIPAVDDERDSKRLGLSGRIHAA